MANRSAWRPRAAVCRGVPTPPGIGYSYPTHPPSPRNNPCSRRECTRRRRRDGPLVQYRVPAPRGREGLPFVRLGADAPWQRSPRHHHRESGATRRVLYGRDRAAPDVRRPGGDRHRERAAVHRAPDEQPRADHGAGHADRHQRHPARHQPLADGRPAGVRRDRDQRRPLAAGLLGRADPARWRSDRARRAHEHRRTPATRPRERPSRVAALRGAARSGHSRVARRSRSPTPTPIARLPEAEQALAQAVATEAWSWCRCSVTTGRSARSR